MCRRMQAPFFGAKPFWAGCLPSAGALRVDARPRRVPAAREQREAAEHPQEARWCLWQEPGQRQGASVTRQWRFREHSEPPGTISPAGPTEKWRAETERLPAPGSRGRGKKARFVRDRQHAAMQGGLSARRFCGRHLLRGRAEKAVQRADRLQGWRAGMAADLTAGRPRGLRACGCPRPGAGPPERRGSGHGLPLPNFSASHFPLAESSWPGAVRSRLLCYCNKIRVTTGAHYPCTPAVVADAQRPHLRYLRIYIPDVPGSCRGVCQRDHQHCCLRHKPFG